MSIRVPIENSSIQKYYHIVKPLLKGFLGCDLNICVIGDVGRDRVNLLNDMVEFINQGYTVRCYGEDKMLKLKELYPLRNILYFSLDNLDDLPKNEPASAHIFSSVFTAEELYAVSQSLTNFTKPTLFSHHARSADKLIASVVSSLMVDTQKDSVIKSANIIIKLNRLMTGEKILSSISEVVPTQVGYIINDLITYDEDHQSYVVVGRLSYRLEELMKSKNIDSWVEVDKYLRSMSIQ